MALSFAFRSTLLFDLMRPRFILSRIEGIYRWCRYLYLNRGRRLGYFSQFGQDHYSDENIFHGKRSGYFVDIGANDGIHCSNTYFFEKSLGWRGLCVEPIYSTFERLRANRNADCVNGCIADFSGTADFLEISGRWEVLSGLLQKYDLRHQDRIKKAVGDRAKKISVPCFRLMDILAERGVTHVDFLSLDTEGGELDILKTIDFSKILIDAITVENNYCTSDIEDFLHSKGFCKIAVVGVDEVYVRKPM